MHAWFSQVAKDKHGSVFYRGENGVKVEVTFVARDREWGEKNYYWHDKVYVGIVTSYIARS